jgi:hypothetical protein
MPQAVQIEAVLNVAAINLGGKEGGGRSVEAWHAAARECKAQQSLRPPGRPPPSSLTSQSISDPFTPYNHSAHHPSLELSSLDLASMA